MHFDLDADQQVVPAAACRFEAGDITVESNGEDAKSAKFSMVARSSRPIEHPFWGRIVHDMDGMQLNDKGRVTIDYKHNHEIGYASKFEIQEDGLHASGALYMPDAKSKEIVDKAAFGIPWQASINFSGSGIRLQKVKPGQSTKVNGFEFEGPGVVVRKWPLRGIAVCPYGADQDTSTEFSADNTVPVSFTGEDDMSKTDPFALNEEQATAVLDEKEGKTKPADEETTGADAEGKEEPVEASTDDDKDVKDESQDSSVEASELTGATPDAKRYMAMFGEQQGALFFAKGVPLVDAIAEHNKARDKRIDELEKRLAKVSTSGEEEALEFSEHTKPKKKHSAVKLPKFLMGGEE